MEDTNFTGEQVTVKAEPMQIDLSTLPIFTPENIRYVKNVVATKLAKEFRQDRDDIEQEIWLKFCMAAKTLPDIQSPKSFSFTIGRNNCLNIKRHSNQEVKYIQDQKTRDIHSIRKSAGGGTKVQYRAQAASPETTLLKSELREKVLKILRSFPPDKVLMIWLYWSGNSPKEIAEITKTPLKTVYGVLKRIQKEIYKELEKEFDNAKKLDDDPDLTNALMDLVIAEKLISQSAASHRRA